jgi:actin-related protein
MSQSVGVASVSSSSLVVEWKEDELIIGHSGDVKERFTLSLPLHFPDLTTKELEKKFRGNSPRNIEINDNILFDSEQRKREGLLWIDIRTLVSQLFTYIFYQLLHIKTKTYRILLIENYLTPAILRDAIYSVLLTDFQVHSVCFQPNLPMVAIATGSSKGLIIDIGEEETQVIAFCFGRVLHQSFHSE